MKRALSFIAAMTAAAAGLGAQPAPAAPQPGGTDAANRITAAVDRTTAAGSAKVSINVDVDTRDSTGSMQADGVVALNGQRGMFTTDLSGLGFESPAPVEYRLIGRDLYVNLSGVPEAAAELPTGKSWVRHRLGRHPRRGADPASNDPTPTLKSLRGVSEKVTVVGPDVIRGGVPTTHYRASVDPRKAVRELPKADRGQAERLVAVLGGKPIPMDVWIDFEGRVTRVQHVVRVARGRKKANILTRVEYFEFGAPVDVQVPPRAEVVDEKVAFPNQKGSLVYS